MTLRRGHRPALAQAEDGTAGLVTMVLALLAVIAGVAALALTVDLALASARARTAADAAALAAAAASPLVAGTSASVGDPAAARAAAAEVSRANGARLHSVDLDLWPLQVGVRVAVAPRTQMVRSIVGMAEAGATAAVRPQVVAPPAI